jgi:hypothetical protein
MCEKPLVWVVVMQKCGIPSTRVPMLQVNCPVLHSAAVFIVTCRSQIQSYPCHIDTAESNKEVLLILWS